MPDSSRIADWLNSPRSWPSDAAGGESRKFLTAVCLLPEKEIHKFMLLSLFSLYSGCLKSGHSKTRLVSKLDAILPIGCLVECPKTGGKLHHTTSSWTFLSLMHNKLFYLHGSRLASRFQTLGTIKESEIQTLCWFLKIGQVQFLNAHCAFLNLW